MNSMYWIIKYNGDLHKSTQEHRNTDITRMILIEILDMVMM